MVLLPWPDCLYRENACTLSRRLVTRAAEVLSATIQAADMCCVNANQAAVEVPAASHPSLVVRWHDSGLPMLAAARHAAVDVATVSEPDRSLTDSLSVQLLRDLTQCGEFLQFGWFPSRRPSPPLALLPTPWR